MMKILIHGRKSGYTTLYPKPVPKEFFSFASDIQSGSARNSEVFYGKMFYTLAFVENGWVYSKYVIGQDVGRGHIGEIGIAVFIPYVKKLAGKNIKQLLDELIEIYKDNYIVDNKITEVRGGFNGQLFTSVVDRYATLLNRRNTNHDVVIKGDKDPAICYYSSEQVLEQYLDKPFQEEYQAYKQILFVESSMEAADDSPLHVIKHSGEVLNLDMDNAYYYLSNYEANTQLEITANGKKISGRKGYNMMRSKWPISVYYQKNAQCYEAISAKGTLDDKSSEIHKYLEIEGNHIHIKNIAFSSPPKKKKQIEFVVKNIKGEKVDDAKIECKIKYSKESCEIEDNKIICEGEEIIASYEVVARLNKNNYSHPCTIIPYEKNGPVELILLEHKKIRFQGEYKENNNEPRCFKDVKVDIKVNGSKKSPSEDQTYDFIDNEIDKEYTVTVRYDDKQANFTGTGQFCPRKIENCVSVEMTKQDKPKTPKYYTIEPGEHGTVKGGDSYSHFKNGQDIEIIPNKGFLFVKFKFEATEKDGFEGVLVAEYQKIPKPILLQKKVMIAALAAILFLFAVGLGCYFGCFKNKKVLDDTPTGAEIIKYVRGDSFLLEQLTSYRDDWRSQNKADDTLKQLNEAISIRQKIDSMSFKDLDYNYFKQSSVQQAFFNEGIEVYKKMDANKKKDTKDELKDSIAYFPLKRIKEIIQKINNTDESGNTGVDNAVTSQTKPALASIPKKEPENITKYLIGSSNFELEKIQKYYEQSNLTQRLNNSLLLVKAFIEKHYKDCDKFKSKAKNDEFLQQNPNINDWVEEVCEKPANKGKKGVMQSADTEIISYIQGDKIKKEDLKKKLKQASNQKVKTSIKLCLQFWNLNGQRDNSYLSYKKQMEIDDYLKNSVLKTFVDERCARKKPKYVTELPAADRKKKLSTIMKKIEKKEQ